MWPSQSYVLVVPLSIPHMASNDVEVGGYTIPKGAMIVPHIYAAHHNPDDWPEPNTFKPERWIGHDNKIRKFDAFLPFSQGQT